VLFLQRQPCVRALKYAVGLRAAWPELTLGFAYQGRTLTQFYGTGDDLFDAWWDLGREVRPAAELSAVLDEFRPDLVHSHNLPDVLSVLAMELAGDDIPVVHDIHDLQSLRHTPYRDGFPEPDDPLGLERAAIEGASALITVSPELVEVVRARYELPGRTLVLGNLALRRDRVRALPERNGNSGVRTVVYEGSLSTDGGHYDLRDHFRAIAAAGLPVVIHPSRPPGAYEDLAAEVAGISCSAPLDPAALMLALPWYDFGWAGFNAARNAEHLDTVLPNKLFEYLGAGLPVVTLGDHKALRRFVAEEGVGVVLDDIADVGDALREADLASLRRTVAAKRDRFTFEAQAVEAIALYRDLAGLTAPLERALGGR
jgi:glycosyltransferase involved in cell wall biosynthesis